jgi:hypothetical protein
MKHTFYTRVRFNFFWIRTVVGRGGVQLGPLGMTATNWQPRVSMRMENLLEWWLAGETEVLGENLPQSHFLHH